MITNIYHSCINTLKKYATSIWFAGYVIPIFIIILWNFPPVVTVTLVILSIICMYMYFRSKDNDVRNNILLEKNKPTEVYAVLYEHNQQYCKLFGTPKLAHNYCNLMNEVYHGRPYKTVPWPVEWSDKK